MINIGASFPYPLILSSFLDASGGLLTVAQSGKNKCPWGSEATLRYA